MKKTVFDIYHPLVAACYFAAILLFAMIVLQPIYLVVSLLGALCYSFYLQGTAIFKQLAWQIPLIALIAIINPLFSQIGSTELFRIGTRVLYLESLIYGACFGIMFVTVITWFSSASKILSTDKVCSLLGNTIPALALVISMSLRLVPRLLQQAREISYLQEANCPSAEQSKRSILLARSRQASVLMGWSMENSLDTADTMRSRGWSSGSKRSTYQRYRFKVRDFIALVVLFLLIVGNTFLTSLALEQFQFYPTVSTLIFWWGYIPYAVLVFFPLIAQFFEELSWKR